MSAIGLVRDTESPLPPGPLPKPSNSSIDSVGTSSGTSTDSPVAVTPILRAEDHTAWRLTSVLCESNSRWSETCRPHCESRVASWAAMRNRKHSAPAANFAQGTPPSRMLIGAVYAASSGSPATGARRSVQAMKSTSRIIEMPETIISGANAVASAGTGAA